MPDNFMMMFYILNHPLPLWRLIFPLANSLLLSQIDDIGIEACPKLRLSSCHVVTLRGNAVEGFNQEKAWDELAYGQVSTIHSLGDIVIIVDSVASNDHRPSQLVAL